MSVCVRERKRGNIDDEDLHTHTHTYTYKRTLEQIHQVVEHLAHVCCTLEGLDVVACVYVCV
jgi:hypothetical protein